MIAVLWISAFTSGVHAQEKYTLKLKEPAPGDSFVFRGSENTKTVTKYEGNQADMTVMETKKGHSFLYTETYLKAPAAPGSRQRSYDKALVTKEGDITILGLEGKTLLIEKKKDGFQFRWEGGGTPQGDDAERLEKEFDKKTNHFGDHNLMPTKAVKLNESWPVDVAEYMKGADENTAKMYDVGRAKFSAKLTRVYKQGDSQFGVIDFEFELPCRNGVEINSYTILEGKVVVKGTFDGCIDGSVFARTTKIGVTFDLRASLGEGGQTLVYQVSTTMEESRKDVAKK
jgi:hypothetical protein